VAQRTPPEAGSVGPREPADPRHAPIDAASAPGTAGDPTAAAGPTDVAPNGAIEVPEAALPGPGTGGAAGAPTEVGVQGTATDNPRIVPQATPISDAAADATEELEPRPRFQAHARVFARAEADERTDYQRNFSLSSARLGATAKLSLLEAEVTADFADSVIVKDAYIRLSMPGEAVRFYGGRFKAPFLARRLQGSWSLPRIGRGLVDDVLIDDEGLSGRRLGLMAEGRLRSFWNLRAQLGVFEGGRDALGLKTGREDLAARIAIRPVGKLTLGTGVYLVSAFSAPHRSAAFGFDATWKLDALRVSAEATGGTLRLGPYTSQSALAAWAIPLEAGRRWQLEPVLGAEALQLHTEQRAVGHAMTAGMNLLYGDWFKAMLQGERALRPGDPSVAFAITFQLAAQLSVE